MNVSQIIKCVREQFPKSVNRLKFVHFLFYLLKNNFAFQAAEGNYGFKNFK